MSNIMPDKKTLLVCNESEFASDFKNRLNKLGYTVCEQAETFKIAIDAMEKHQPDLVIVDMALQGDIDGIDTANFIRDKWETPVFFLTDSVDSEHLKRSCLVHFFWYILSSLKDSELAVTIEMGLNIAQMAAEKKDTQEKLLREKQMLARTERIAGIGSWELDIESGRVVWSEELFRIFKIKPSAADPSWSEYQDLIYPEDRELLGECIKKAIDNGTPYEFEVRVLRRDGELRLCILRRYAEKDSNGKVTRLFGSVQDTTKLKSAEEALKENEEKYRAIFEQAADAILLYDPEDELLVEYNEKLYKNLGYTREEFKEIKLPDIEAIESGAEVAEHNRAILNKGEDIFESKHRTKNGELRDVLISGRVLSIGPKKYIQYISRDITEIKQAERLLKDSDKKSKQLNLLLEKLLTPNTLQNKMRIITDGVEEIFDTVLSRIWIIMPGDKCDSGCYHSQTSKAGQTCGFRDKCLHLTASSGSYSLLDGDAHYRIPFGKNKIGRIASGAEADILSNNIIRDLEIENHTWGTDSGLTSFAAYRLLSEDGSPVGVLSVLSSRFISPLDNNLLKSLSNSVAHVIQASKAEEALRVSEQNLSSMMANTQDVIVRIDKNFRHIFANTSLYDTIGISPEQYLGKTNEELDIPEDLTALLHEKYKKVFATGKTETFETTYKTFNKGFRFFQSVVSPEFDENNRVETIINSARDITDLKHAEQALKESEALLEATGKMAKIGGWEFDTNTLEIRMTEQINRMFEIPPDFEPDQFFIDHFIHQDDRDILYTAVQNAMEHGKPFDLELRLFTTNGKSFWNRSICIPQTVDGKVLKLKGTCQDITELKQAEQALKDSEKRYRSLIELSPLGIGMVDGKGMIIDINHAFVSMLGYEANELLALNFRDITHPDDLKRENKLIQALLDGDKMSYSIEKRYQHKNGIYLWINLSAAKIPDPDGEQVFIFGFIEDISIRKQMEQEREKLIQELQEAITEIKELRGIFPICANCKKIRDDDGYWQQVEHYIADRTAAKFSHGICSDCAKKLYPEIYK